VPLECVWTFLDSQQADGSHDSTVFDECYQKKIGKIMLPNYTYM